MLRGGEVVIQKKRISFGCHHFLLSVLQTSISEGNLSKERTTRSQRNGGTRFSCGQLEPHETSRFNTTESSIRSSERVKSQDEGTSELGYGSAARIPNQFPLSRDGAGYRGRGTDTATDRRPTRLRRPTATDRRPAAATLSFLHGRWDTHT